MALMSELEAFKFGFRLVMAIINDLIFGIIKKKKALG